MHRACALLVSCVLLAAGPAHARRANKKNDLLRVVTPAERSTASAHPFVNVIVRFGETSSGLPADPQTFRARLGRNDVTAAFFDIVENGAMVGKRAAIEPPLLHEGRAINKLRLEVRTVPQPKKNGRPGRRLRDIDRVRFRATPADDNAPVARITASTEVILPGIPVQFSAEQSTDADNDALVAHWDFGDGQTSDDWEPSHVYTDSATDVFVTLTVSDRDLSSNDQRQLLATPPLCPGCTPGLLKIPTGDTLEFGAVAPGGSQSLTFTVQNPDATATSQLHTRVGTDSATITAAPADFALGPGATQTVTVTFAPTGPGHQSANITLVASASGRPVVHFVAHGFGGSGPPPGPCGTFTGPTLAADPLFYADLIGNTSGILADGTRFCADNGVHACLAPNGVGSLDLCTSDADCVTPGEVCAQSSTCIGGDRRNQVCVGPNDCSGGGICRSYATAEPVDMCGDGTGGLYLITDIGTFTDPNPGDTELSTTIVRLQFDPATGARSEADVLARATDQTNQIACDGFAAAAGGQLFVPQFFNIANPPTPCSRDQKEVLTAFTKAHGAQSVILPDVDAAGGYAECDDFDQASDLEVSRDGSAMFVSLPLTGLYRVRPTSLAMSPDITDFFQLHPDGSVIYVTTNDVGTTGSIKLYRISPDQAVHGAPHLSDLTPCAVYQVPNNRYANRGQTLIGTSSFAVDRAAPGSQDAIVLISFVTTGGFPDVPRTMLVQGTLIIAAPANSNNCTVLGYHDLEFNDPITF